MYRRIMVPVDLAHIEKLGKAITTATDLAKHYGIPICFVGVTAGTPTEVAHTPEEFGEKLKQFGARQSEKHGLKIETAASSSHDPAVDLDKRLITAARQNEASHVPDLREHIFASHAGTVASHAEVSVFVIR